MPGWHERTRDLQERGKLQVVGWIQEQHPARCRLFLQWHRMGWPVLVDSLNLLGVSAVPLTYLIDEHGIVRKTGRIGEKDLETFLETDYPESERSAEKWPAFAAMAARWEGADENGSEPRASLARGTLLFLAAQSALMGGKEERFWSARLDGSIDALRRAVDRGGPPEAGFRLGAALRLRYETSARRPGDFQAAVAGWRGALARRPNQYIWRRRIQQYGPRLDKPYSFYDWIRTAREEIRARGEKPVELPVEPRGAELAYPAKKLDEASGSGHAAPDPEARIRSDQDGLVDIDPTVVPSTTSSSRSARVHIVLRPSPKKKAHWNNEAGKLRVWIDPPAGAEVSERFFAVGNAEALLSTEPRTVELEVQFQGEEAPRKRDLTGYALYFVCEDEDGVCYYLRQDFRVPIDIR